LKPRVSELASLALPPWAVLRRPFGTTGARDLIDGSLFWQF
jgi:hypothetical protein